MKIEIQKLIEQIESNNPALTSIVLQDGTLTQEELSAIINALQKNSHIQTLNLSNNPIPLNEMQVLVQLLKRQQLKLLTLVNAQISDYSAGLIAGALEKNSSLLELNLAENLIGDKGAIEIAWYSIKSSLQKVDLGGNNITDGGAAEVCNITGVKKDFSVDLKGNPEGDGLIHIEPVECTGACGAGCVLQ